MDVRAAQNPIICLMTRRMVGGVNEKAHLIDIGGTATQPERLCNSLMKLQDTGSKAAFSVLSRTPLLKLDLLATRHRWFVLAEPGSSKRFKAEPTRKEPTRKRTTRKRTHEEENEPRGREPRGREHTRKRTHEEEEEENPREENNEEENPRGREPTKKRTRKRTHEEENHEKRTTKKRTHEEENPRENPREENPRERKRTHEEENHEEENHEEENHEKRTHEKKPTRREPREENHEKRTTRKRTHEEETTRREPREETHPRGREPTRETHEEMVLHPSSLGKERPKLNAGFRSALTSGGNNLPSEPISRASSPHLQGSDSAVSFPTKASRLLPWSPPRHSSFKAVLLTRRNLRSPEGREAGDSPTDSDGWLAGWLGLGGARLVLFALCLLDGLQHR
nr:TRIO and F-actin-binding protein-like [Penaeus vannamei]